MPPRGTVATSDTRAFFAALLNLWKRSPGRNGQPERAAHRAAQRLPRKRVGGARGRNRAGRAAGVRRAKSGADIPRILCLVEDHHELWCAAQRVLDGGPLEARDGDNPGGVADGAHGGQHG